LERFSNFAISLTIICVLSGCFTTFGQAWNDGGPIAISIGWPLISLLVLLVGLSMAELASKYPTAGGIYYWAYSLGGVRWAWFTGWFNLLGLIAITAAVDYGAASFLNSVLALYGFHFIINCTTTSLRRSCTIRSSCSSSSSPSTASSTSFSSHLVSLLNRISAWWMLGGVIAIVGILIFGPSTHQSASFVFSHRINNSGFSGHFYWFMILPLGFLLTMYTFTGYDASAHLSEETHDAERAAPRGLWTSIAIRRSADGRCCSGSPSRQPTSPRSTRAVAERFRSSSRRSAPVLRSSSSTSQLSDSCSVGWAAWRPPRAWCSRSRATAPCRAMRCGEN